MPDSPSRRGAALAAERHPVDGLLVERDGRAPRKRGSHRWGRRGPPADHARCTDRGEPPDDDGGEQDQTTFVKYVLTTFEQHLVGQRSLASTASPSPGRGSSRPPPADLGRL